MPEARTRALWEIAVEIKRDWTKPYFGAVPYIDALSTLGSVTDMYYYDPADDIIRYFLANANTWRGETARRVKAELRSMLS
jgi:hypothetical protein